MPSDWKLIKLKNIGFHYGGLTSKSKDDFGKGKKYIPYLNVYSNRYIDRSQLDLVEIQPSERQNKVEKGDLFFTTSSETPHEVGMTSVLLEDVVDTYLNSFCFGFRLNNFNTLWPTYASFLFRSDEVRGLISKLAQGSTRYNLSKSIFFEKLILDLPPLPQQKKIADILSTCDRVIEQTEAAIRKYEAIKKGMMHDLFTRGIDVTTGKLRPTYAEALELYKESELGWIPREWEVREFISLADDKKSHSFTGGPFGSDLQTKHYTTEGVRIIQLQNIGDGVFQNNYKIYTSAERANYLKACNIFPGEIILSKMADPIARACFIPDEDDRYLMASDGIRLAINDTMNNSRFILELINQNRFRREAEVKSTGTTRARIGLTELKAILISLPPKPEQDIIGDLLDIQITRIETEFRQMEKWIKVKQGLMQDLLTGKVSVGECEVT